VAPTEAICSLRPQEPSNATLSRENVRARGRESSSALRRSGASSRPRARARRSSRAPS
jgi:hypothetical protein